MIDEINPPPVIVEHEGIYVVRDDMIDGGSKSRFVQQLIKESPETEMVYGSSPASGYAQISLAKVCAHYGKKAVLFMAKRNKQNFHPYQLKALQYGAIINMVENGMLTVTEKRARDYVDEDTSTRKLFPIGFFDIKVLYSIRDVALSLPIKPTEVWTVGSSGALTRGLQLAWPDAEFNCVSVGHKMGQKELGRAKMYKCEIPFDKSVSPEDAPPFPSVPTYDAKAWKFIKQYAKPGALFWNVGA
jgi:hypothetical protein